MKKLFLILIAIFTISIANAQWQQCNGPYGGWVVSMAVKGDTLFAGTSSGVYMSPNNGISWVDIGLKNQFILSLALKGSYVFAGTQNSGIYLSTDFGNTWNTINNGLNLNYVSSLIVSGNNIYAAETNNSNGVFKSSNNGISWSSVTNGLPTNCGTYSMAHIDSNIFIGNCNGVYLSTNNGLSWNPVNTGITNLIIHNLAVIGNKTFCRNKFRSVFIN